MALTLRDFIDTILGPNQVVNARTMPNIRAAYDRFLAQGSAPAPGGPDAPPAGKGRTRRVPPPRPGKRTRIPPPPKATPPKPAPKPVAPGGRAAPPSSPPSPSASDPKTLPGSVVLEDRIIDLDQQLANLPFRFNPARRALAANTAADLAESGLFEDVDQTEQDLGGNLVFQLQGRGRGRAFTNQIGNINATHAARGTFGSSFARDAANEATRQLDNRAAAALRAFGGQQGALSQQQADLVAQLTGERHGARRDLTDFQASSKPFVPFQAPTPQNVGAAKPGPGSGDRSRITFAGGTQAGLQSRLNKRFGAGTYTVKARGPKVGGFVAVRR